MPPTAAFNASQGSLKPVRDECYCAFTGTATGANPAGALALPRTSLPEKPGARPLNSSGEEKAGADLDETRVVWRDAADGGPGERRSDRLVQESSEPKFRFAFPGSFITDQTDQNPE